MGKCSSTQIIKLKSRSNQYYSIDIEHSILSLESSFSRQGTLNKHEKSLISSTLQSHHLFSYLSTQDIEKVYSKLMFFTIEAFEIIYSQGSIGENFYIVSTGKVDVIKDGELKFVLSRGKTFGDLALMTCCTRNSTVRTNEESSLWVLNKRDYLEILRGVHQRDYGKNKHFIETLSIFRGFSETSKSSLTLNLVQHMYQDSQAIISENEEGSLLFILKQGSAIAKQSGIEKFRIKQGELFGESAILNTEPKYTNSVYSVGTVHCLSIDFTTLKKILGENFNEVLYKSVAKHNIFSDKILGMIPAEYVNSLVEKMEWVKLRPGDIAVNPGCKSCLIYTTCVGNFKCGDFVFGSNQAFGLGNKNHKLVKQYGMAAQTDSVIGVSYQIPIETCLKITCKILKNQLKLTYFLSKIEFLSNLELKELKYLASKVKILEFDSKELIFEKNHRADSFFIIYKGKVEILSNNKIIRVLNKYDIFGESCIKVQFRNKTARAICDSICVQICVNAYLSLLESIETSRILHRKSIMSLFSIKQCFKISKKVESPYQITILSSFGSENPHFSVAVINKTMVTNKSTCLQIIHSKKIAQYLEHNFLLKYVNGFLDSSFVYIFYEYVYSLPFSAVPKEIIDEDYVKLISACLLSVIEYLHNRSIMYRDLCTENISIKSNGHPILTTFSPAKLIKARTYSILGDPLFNAPEFYAEKGYTKTADLWSLGVFIYFHIYFQYPFEVHKKDSPLDIYAKTSTKNLEFPKDSSLFDAQELLQTLLNKDPCMRNNTKSIKCYKWYCSIDWQRLQNEQYSMKFKPPDPHMKKKAKNFPLIQRYVNVKNI